MEWLRRSAAPLSAKVWKEIDDIAGSMFKQTVVARRIVDFDGPRGWQHVATQLGTFKPGAAARASGNDRILRPDIMLLTEIRAELRNPWADIDSFERFAPALASKSIEDAAHAVALAEQPVVFYGRSVTPA